MYSVKGASDFRREAREALSGRWWLAVGTTTVASMIGLSTIGASGGGSSPSVENVESPELLAILLLISTVATLISIANFILAGPITLGYIQFTMKAYDNERPQFTDIFSQFNRFGEGFCVYALRVLYVFLWGLAAVAAMLIVGIPLVYVLDWFGVIIFYLIIIAACIFMVYKTYGYALAPYIVYSNPGIGAVEAIRKSVDLMDGNRWRLFCMQFSFIGWNLLAYSPMYVAMFISPEAVVLAFPLCVGGLWVKTYMEFTNTAFYRQVASERKGSHFIKDENQSSDNSDFMSKLQDAGSVVEHSKWNF